MHAKWVVRAARCDGAGGRMLWQRSITAACLQLSRLFSPDVVLPRHVIEICFDRRRGGQAAQAGAHQA